MSEEEKQIKGKILVIDDHPFFPSTLKYKFEKHGYEVFSAKDGANGIIIAKKVIPDVIFIDYIMPGMDGIETCKKLKQQKELEKTYLLLYTSEAYPKIVAEAVKAGAVDFVTKTTPFETILKKVENLLGNKQ